MADLRQLVGALSPVQKQALRRLLDDSAEDAGPEPIAIVGMGCRLPGGVKSPEELWQRICERFETATRVPADRFDIDSLYDPDPERPGKISTPFGHFVDGVDQFDAEFFGLSAREAAALDPQQRFLLEVAYEALADAGQPLERLEGSETGVFVGICHDDYLLLQRGPESLGIHSGTGTSYSVAAGRLSHLFDLHGPSIAIDTACSSSLVAVHLAVQSLRNRECSLALAAGVNLMLEPTYSIISSRMRLLSADGECKAFDASADGMGRGEGCGVVALKRLSDARASGDRIVAVIRGSAVNQDGRTSGITAPNGLAQRAVLKRALADARLSPSSIGYIEAHGTGTPLGDPIEIEALNEIYGRGDGPCYIGSAKANVGHLEAAAGIVGLIRAALCVRHGKIPAQANFRSLNPHLDLAASRLAIPTQTSEWRSPASGPRRAGVSSFGWSGTNAHLLLEECPAMQEPASIAERLHLLVLSARSEASLRALAGSHRALLEHLPATALGDLCFSASTRASHHPHRLAVLGASPGELVAQLESFLGGTPSDRVARGTVTSRARRRIAFVFSGQGSQWSGMARRLGADEPIFREALATCRRAVLAESGPDVTALLEQDGTIGPTAPIEVVQPLLFSLQVALCRLWASWGVVPEVVVGHSMGEVAAACVAGALTLEDAAAIICRRSRLMKKMRRGGAMAAIDLGLEGAQELVAKHADRLSIAASNGPSSTVLSGDAQTLEPILADLERAGVFVRRLGVEIASHSQHTEEILPELIRMLAEIRPRAGSIPICSTVDGELIDGSRCDPQYWARNLRQPVLLWPAVRRLRERGFDCFIEISGHPILVPAIEEGLRQDGGSGLGLHSLRRDVDDGAALRSTLARLHVEGYPVRLEALHPRGGRTVALPRYPWNHRGYWLEPRPRRAARSGTHPLLGDRVQSSLFAAEHLWEVFAAAGEVPFLADHRLRGNAVFPGAGYLELAHAAASELLGGSPFAIESLELHEVLPVDGDQRAQLAITRTDATLEFRCSSRAGSAGPWTLHASGTIRVLESFERVLDEGHPDEHLAGTEVSFTGDQLRERFARREVEYGPAYQGVERVCVRGDRASGTVRLPPDALPAAGLALHPALVDACFQVAAAPLLEAADDRPLILSAIERAVFVDALPARLEVRARVRSAPPASPERAIDLSIHDEAGRRLGDIRGLQVRRVASRPQLRWLHRLDWSALPDPGELAETGGHWLVLVHEGSAGAELAAALESRGARVTRVRPGTRSARPPSGWCEVAIDQRADVDRLLAELGPVDHVVHAWSLGSGCTGLPDAQQLGVESLLLVVQALAAASRAPRLWVITDGVPGLPTSPNPDRLLGASLWGLVRVLANEHRELRATAIDVGAAPSGETIARLVHELVADGPETQVALDGRIRRAPRLGRCSPETLTTRPLELRADASYLITGGHGALGLAVAAWMVDRGARHLVLVGRHAPADSEAIRSLRQAGATIKTAALDVADRASLAALFDELRETLPPLRGIQHAAGVLDDGVVTSMTVERLRKVMAPKVLGAWNLHELSADLELDFFVVFSSAAALLGSPGQSNYVAANAFMDALAHLRRAGGKPALSINWGGWSEIGLAAASANRGERLAARGLGSLAPGQNLKALEALMHGRETQVAVMELDAPRFLAAHPGTGGLLHTLVAAGLPTTGPTESLRSQLDVAPAEHREALVVEYLRAEIARTLGLGAREVDLERPLAELGIESLMGTEVRGRIRRDTGAVLPLLDLVRGPSITELARKLLALVSSASSPASSELPLIRHSPEQRYQPFPLGGVPAAFFMGRSEAFEYHIGAHYYTEIEVEGLELPRYEAAWQKVIARHDMLRAVMTPDATQRVLRETPRFSIEVADLRGDPDRAMQAALATRAELAHCDPNLESWPTIVVRATVLPDRKTRLHFLLNNAFTDGLSAQRMFLDSRYFYEHPDGTLPELEVTYRDWLEGMKAVQESELGRQSRAYWQARIESVPPAPPLPIKPHDPRRRSRFVRRGLKLDAARWVELKRNAAARRVTPSAAMYGAFAEILACWSGSGHYTLNMMISNRLPLHPQVDQLVGNFAALVFLEIDLRGKSTFVERVARIQEQLLRDLEHRYVGGIEVLQELNRAHGHVGGAPVPIVVASSLHMKKESGSDELIAYGRPTEFSCLETPQAWFDHQFYELADDSLYLVWDVLEEIFADGVIDAMWSAYTGLVDRLCIDQRAWQVERFELVPPGHALVMREANRTDRPIPAALLHDAFFEAARKHADRPAVITPRETLTYRQLARRVKRIGRRLRELNARPNELVAVVMEKGWEQIAAVLGILASGAAYVPIDASVPGERRDHLLANAEARLVLTQRRFERALGWPGSVRVLCVDDELFDDALDDGPLASVQTPDDLAYVIYTSGSTGTPKGVAIDHRAAWNTIADVNGRFDVDEQDRVLAASSLSFDLSVYDVFGTLAAGAAVVVPDADASRDPEHWLELMIEEGVTIWNSAPALMQLLLESAGTRPGSLPRLRLVLLSGDWIAVTMPDAVRRLAPHARVISLGGATEASIWSIFHPIDEVDPTWTSIPYGKPLANQSWRVLDAELRPCPLWSTGELYIGGVGLARGYWRDATRTAESFITHPDGERLYRTGDLGRYLPDGTIEFLGRNDHQIKIQGFRVELGEVEAALLRHPAVREAVVVAQDHGRAGKTLVGFAVLADELGAEDLRAFLARSLPQYLVPTVIVVLDALPLTRNGKLDRAALPKVGDSAASRVHEPPADELEARLAKIWEDVLAVPMVGRKDDFFELGGQSFAAVRVVARIRQQLGFRVSLGVVFEARTIEGLAARLRKSDRWSALVAVQSTGDRPASFWVHPAGGNVLCYQELSRALGSDRPMYAFQAAGLGGEQAPLSTVEEMAELYLQELKRVQPSGPYLIGGWSSGGVIAFELAQRLERAGESVSALVLIDAPTPNAGLELDETKLDAWFLQDLGEVPAGIDEAHLEPIRAVFKANLRAVQRHSPGTLAAHTIVFRATEGVVGEFARHPDRGEADWGWSRYAKGRLTTIDAAATHYTLLTPPHVAELSSKIIRAIDG